MFKAKISKVQSKTGPRMAILGAIGDVKLNVWFCDPQKAHTCAESCLLTYFA